MSAPEIYHPEQWKDFFVLVGTGAAALMGLVFVAMTISIKTIMQDATHRYRAINMLTGFTSVFIMSALAIMGPQVPVTLGIEWLIVSLIAVTINTNGYIQAFKLHSSLYGLSLFRMVGGSICYLCQIIGASLLLLGFAIGLYITAIAVIINLCFFISGSWLLILGTLHNIQDKQ